MPIPSAYPSSASRPKTAPPPPVGTITAPSKTAPAPPAARPSPSKATPSPTRSRKAETIEAIKANLGQVDLIVYSLASPVRTDPKDGVTYRSAIKPYGQQVTSKTLNTATGEVSEITVDPATEEEAQSTIKVMGGEDWELWIKALSDAGVLADGFLSLNYTYLGSELTWPIYQGHAGQGQGRPRPRRQGNPAQPTAKSPPMSSPSRLSSPRQARLFRSCRSVARC